MVVQSTSEIQLILSTTEEGFKSLRQDSDKSDIAAYLFGLSFTLPLSAIKRRVRIPSEMQGDLIAHPIHSPKSTWSVYPFDKILLGKKRMGYLWHR